MKIKNTHYYMNIETTIRGDGIIPLTFADVMGKTMVDNKMKSGKLYNTIKEKTLEKEVIRGSKRDLQNINNINSINNKIRVGFCGSNHPYLFKNTSGNIDGLDFDIWRNIEKELLLECEHVYISEPNYEREINNLQNGKYDVLIGNLSNTYQRQQKVMFSSPTYIEKNRIIYHHEPRDNYYPYIDAFYKRAIVPGTFLLGTILLFSIVMSILFKRDSLFNSFTKFMGFSKTSSVTDVNIYKMNSFELLLGVIVVVISFFFSIYMQGATTSDILRIEATNDPFFNIYDLEGKTLLVLEGSAQEEYLTQLKQKINVSYETFTVSKRDSQENKVNSILHSEIVDYYNKHLDKYDGIYIPEEAYETSKERFPNLKKSVLDMGFDEIGIAFQNKHHTLLSKVNVILSKIKDNETLVNQCMKYMTTGYTKCIL